MGKILNFFYNIPKFLFVALYRLLIRIRVFNRKNIPIEKPAILAINHTTGADPVIILTAIKKEIYFLADGDNFKNRFINFFMRKFTKSIPLFKKQFNKNTKTFKELFALKNGKNFFYGIFPEGRLNKKGKISGMDKGAAYLSYKTKLPIIPIYIHNIIKGPDTNCWLGRNRVLEGVFALIINTFRKINIFIGEPIYPIANNIITDVKGLTDKKTYRHIIDEIHQALEKEFFLLESESEKFNPTSEDIEDHIKKTGNR